MDDKGVFLWPTDAPSMPMNRLAWMLLALAMVLAAGVAITYCRTLVRRLEPLVIYHRVARAVGLSLIEQHQLWRIARRTGLTSPLTLLLSATTLEHHAEQYLLALPPKQAAAARERVRQIGARLFDATDGAGTKTGVA